MGRSRRAQQRKLEQVTAAEGEKRDLLARQKELRAEVAALSRKVQLDPHDRESIVCMSSVEALVDQMCELGLIDRTKHNTLTLVNMKRRLTKLAPSLSLVDKEQKASA